MENKLSITEIRYMRSLASKKTDEQLAEMMGKPVELIEAQFALMSGLPKRPGNKVKPALPSIPEPVIMPAVRKKQVPKPPKKEKIRKPGTRTKVGSQRDKQAKKAVKKRVLNQINEKVLHRQKEWKDKNEKVQFKTKTHDQSGTFPVKLNAKTIVWVKPGTNIEELKKKLNIQ